MSTYSLQKAPSSFGYVRGSGVFWRYVLKKLAISALVLFSSSGFGMAQSWTGKASYYGAKGRMTCAHRSLPFGTHVRVTNLANQRSTVLVVNDRGPYIGGRIIDVSKVAANVLGFRRAGVVPVTVETVTD
jgi:rare lipoprotein A